MWAVRPIYDDIAVRWRFMTTIDRQQHQHP